MDPLKELLTALGYKIVEREGYEADDILGTLAKTCTDTGNQCVIATGDRDSLQLINDRVTVRLATTKAGQPHSTIYGVEEVKEKYGVAPQQLIDVKALMGDASDNIPGVAGIGEKTALTLISLYGDLDYIYDHLPELDIKPGVRSKLEAGKEMAYTSRDLARIYCESPVDTKLEDYIPRPVDHTKAARLLGRLEMFSMMNRWGIEKDAGGGDGAAPQTPPKSAQVLYNPENGEALAFKEKRLDLLADFGGPSAVRAVAAALSDEQILLIEGEERATAFLRKLLSSEAEIRVFSSKPIYKFAYISDINIRNVIFDCELAAYLLNPTSSSYGVSQLAVGYEIEMRAIENELPEEMCIRDRY